MRFAQLIACSVLMLGAVGAHPLGEGSIARQARLEFTSAGEARVRYVADYGEIAAYGELARIDQNADAEFSPEERAAYATERAREIAARLDLTLNGERLPLTPAAQRLDILPGQGRLLTLRLEVDLAAPLPGWASGARRFAGELRDGNFSGRKGWREILLLPAAALRIERSTAGTVDVSAGLRAYPDEKLVPPPQQDRAEFVVEVMEVER